MKRAIATVALLLASSTGSGDEPYRAVEEVLSTGETVLGEPLRFPEGASPTVHAVVITLRPGEVTARHLTAPRCSRTCSTVI